MSKLSEEELVTSVLQRRAKVNESEVRAAVAICLNVLAQEYINRPWEVVGLLTHRPGIQEQDNGT